MGRSTMTYLSHDEYFGTVPMDVQPRLAQIQAKVESLIPGASRCIGYNMPAFRDKRIFYYFAAFKKHIVIMLTRCPPKIRHPSTNGVSRWIVADF